MKLRQYLAGSLLALMALATSCTSEELVTTGGGSAEALPEGAVQFSIDGINTGAVESRAVGGTVVATAQENQVNNLTILVFGSENASALDADLIFQDYWTANKRADYVCDTENKTFALKGMGRYYTATIVVPVKLKATKYVFLTNEPRVFDVSSFDPAAPAAATFGELKMMYKKEADHLHVGYALQGKKYTEALQMLGMADALDGVGVPAGYTEAVPTALPCNKLPFVMENNYFGFVAGQRDALSMAGISFVDQSVVDGQTMDVTLYRNVARLDVTNDNIKVKSLVLTNISTLGTIGTHELTALPLQLNAVATDVQSTYSLTVTDAITGDVTIPTRSYCYPSFVGSTVVLTGEMEDGTKFEIPFVDKDTKAALTVKSNHRYIINLHRTSDNNIDANIIVKDWQVGEVLDVDLSGGDAVVPAPTLYDASNDALITWEGTSKVVAMVDANYAFNSTNPATYPWLRFDLPQMSSLGLKLYYKDQETNYPGAFFDPNMTVYKTTEAVDGTSVRHELMLTQPGTSTQWLKLQNNFDPALSYVVKIETGNMEVTGTNMKTPALIFFAETNTEAQNQLIAFPSGGFDGPYSKPVTWADYRGTRETIWTGYVLPTTDQMQNICPDEGWGVFANYNGVNVRKNVVDANTTVLYSGSQLDHNVVRVVVDRSQTGANLGTAATYVNLEATLWHYDAKGYLKINQVNVAVPGADAGRLTNYTALMDIFNNKQSGSTGITRFFPASDSEETLYTCAAADDGGLVFNSTEVRFVAQNYVAVGTSTTYHRPVMDGTMTIPSHAPISIPQFTK